MELLDNHLIDDTKILKDNSKRAEMAVNIFWAICLINIVAVMSGYFELDLLERMRDGYDFTDAEVENSDLRQAVIGGMQSLIYIASMVFFLNWFRRAYGNLHRLKISELQYSETMTIWGFIIPIMSLFVPFRIAKEIVKENRKKLKELIAGYQSPKDYSIIGIWWAIFLITNYAGNFALRSIFKDNTIEELITSSQAYLVTDLIDIPAAIITLVMIKQISKEEVILYENMTYAELPPTVDETDEDTLV